MKLLVEMFRSNFAIVFLALIVACVSVTVIACAKNSAGASTPALQPQAVDAFDQYAFDELATAKAGIDQAKAEIAAGNLPKSATPIVNDAIGAYNLAEGLAARYHSTGGTSLDASQLQSEITADLASVAGYIGQLKTAAAGRKAAGVVPSKTGT